MPQYLEAMRCDIDTLNDEMEAVGVRILGIGMHPASRAKSLRAGRGEVIVTDEPYLEAKEHIGGLWMLECPDLDEAVGWGRKAVAACRVPVEVRALWRDASEPTSG